MTIDIDHHAFRSAPGDGQMLGPFGRVRVSSANTGGAFEVLELTGQRGPAPHVHHQRDECFVILEGTFNFVLGMDEVEAKSGSVVYIPRGTRHGFKPGEGGRALVFIIPAGLEGFFRELGEGLRAGRSDVDLRAALAGKYDSEPAE